jgi:hypothetical protein
MVKRLATYVRSPILKKQVIEIADYKCELNASHTTFIAKSNNKPYMEGHHARPMNAQENFHVSLDIYANIICLCPLVPLKLLYLYCAGAGIPDIEAMEQEDVDGFKKSLQGKCGTKTKVYMQIINSTRRFLFLSSPKTNWDANVWYMDRFTFKLDRLNPAYHIGQFSFCTIKDKENRDLFKSFMKNLIGISHRALNTVQGKYTDVRVFLLFCDRMGIKAKRILQGRWMPTWTILMKRETAASLSTNTLMLFFPSMDTWRRKGRFQRFHFRASTTGRRSITFIMTAHLAGICRWTFLESLTFSRSTFA